MATFSVSASAQKNASGSSWSSDKARQGVYSSTRYEGAIRFADLANYDFSNIEISEIQMRITFGPAGGDSTKNLTFYKATKDAISGSIASMRGTSIGAISVSGAYNRTKTLTFNASTNSGIFQTIKSYFAAGNQTQIIYVPTTRGTYSSIGCCYDYLTITAMTLSFTFQYLQSTGSMAATSVTAGNAATLNITAYNSAYTHRVTWKFGSYSSVQTVAAGATSASYTIPLTWLNAIPSALSGAASATLETLDTGGNVLGTSSYSFTITAPSSVIPSIGSITAAAVNENSVLAGWGVYAYGKSKAKLTISSAAGSYGSTIKSYSITTSPNVGSASTSTMTTGYLYQTGTITVTAKVTDSRGRTASKTTSFSVYGYGTPYYSSISAYRCNSGGTRDDLAGTYAYIKVNFGCSVLNGSNTVSGSVTLTQVGGSYTQTQAIASGTGYIMGSGSLAVDATYNARITLTDTVGTTSTYDITIPSAAYIMHIKKGGKAVGFGTAAGADNTVTFGWAVKLNAPLEVSQGGTGGSSAAAARANLGAVNKAGDTMTGNLNIQGSLYPSQKLLPTYNNTTNQSIQEGSYVGATSFSSWEDSSGNNRRMLEVRNAAYESSMDNAVVLRSVINSSYYTYRMFHAGMATPIPVGNGGTGASNAKAALNNLGIFYAASLPATGTDGQVCLVPV